MEYIQDSVFPLESLIQQSDWETIVRTIKENPNAAQTKQKVGDGLQFPIYTLLKGGAPFYVIDSVLSSNENIFNVDGHYSEDPLRLAIATKDLQIVKSVLTHLLNLVKQGPLRNENILHFALEQVDTPEEIIAELLEHFPDSPNKASYTLNGAPTAFGNNTNITPSFTYPIEIALKNGYSRAVLNMVSVTDPSINVDMLNPALENPSLNPEVFAIILRLSLEKYNSFAAPQAPMAGRHGLQSMNPLGAFQPISHTVENNPVSNKFCTALTTALTKCASMSIFRMLIASDLCREVLRVPSHRNSLLHAFITHSGDSALYRAHSEEGLSVLQDFVERCMGMDPQSQISMSSNARYAISCNSPLLRCFVNRSNCQEVHVIEVRVKGGDLHKYRRIFLHIALSTAVVTAQTVKTLVDAWPGALLTDEQCSRNKNKGDDPAQSVWQLVAPHPNSVLLVMVQGLQKLMGQYDLSKSFGNAARLLVHRLGSITNDTTQEEIATLTSHLEYCIAHNPSALAHERSLHRFVQYCSAEAVRAVLKDNNFVMKTDNQGCLCLHGVLRRPEIVQALLEAGSADEQRNFLVNCKLPFHPAPHKQVTAVEMAVAASAPLQVVELLVHDKVQNVLCSLAISNKAPDEVCLFLLQRYPDEVNAQLLSRALHTKCSDSIIVALLNVLTGTLHKATFTTVQHPVLLVLLAGHYAESTVDQVLAEFDAKGVNASLVTVAMRHKCSERALLRLLALTRSSPTDVSSQSLSPTPEEGAEALLHPLLLALSHGLDNIFYSVDTLCALMAQFPGGAAQSCDFFHGVTDSPLAFALRLGYSAEVLNLLISEYPAAVVAMVPSRTKRPGPLWERALRDSESSQDRTKGLSSTERTKPDIDVSSEEGREHLRILATSSAGVALLCLKALELELATNKRLFVHIMAMAELTSFTASMIAEGLFQRRPDLKYLCMEAAEKTPRTETRDLLHTYVFFCGRYQQTIGAPLHRSATAVVVEFSDHEVVKEYAQSYHVYVETGGDLVKALATIHVQASPEAVKQLQTFAEEDAAAVVASEDASPASPGSPVTAPSNSKLIGQQAYETFCVEKFGRTRKVVIKFMRDRVQYDREIQTREKQHLEEQFVVPLLRRGPGAEQLAKEIKEDLKEQRGIRHVEPAYQFGLIMPAADRSVEAIFLSERPDVNEVRVYMRQIGEALSHCHQRGIVHGDLKMLNVIRVGGLLRLIDLDASAPLVRGSKLGAKFSSGVLPPEMFAWLDETGVAKFEAYWEKARNTELWQKIAPRTIVATGATKSYVVKTFDGNAAERQLPYKLQDASPAADYWAYGLLLYRFLSGEHLLSVNRDDDLVGAAEYQQAMTWSPEEIQAQLAPLLEKNYHTAVELLTCLLQPSAQKREEKSLTFLLQNALFFKEDEKTGEKKDAVSLQILASIEDLRRTKNSEMAVLLELRARSERIECQTQRLPQMSATLIKRMNKMEKVMLKAVVEAADVVTPSCFLIVDQKILEEGEKPKDATQSDAMVKKATSWVANLGKITGAVSQVMSKDGREKLIREAFDSILQSQSLYLYLVDEYTLLPIVSYTHPDLPEYPFEIKMNSKDAQKMVAKMMPLLQAGLTAMSIANSALTLARCLGYPVPVLSKELEDQATAAVDKLNKKSNVEQYSLLQDILDCKYGENADGGSEGDASSSVEQNKSVRGAPLREFARYLGEKDPLCKFAGLQRYAADNGLVAWLTAESLRKVSEEAQREEEEEETNLHMLTKELDAVDIAAKELAVPPPLPVAVVPVAPTAQHVLQTQMQVDSARTLQELEMLRAELARLQQVNSQQQQVISEQNTTISSMQTTIAAQNSSLGGLQTTVSSQHAVIQEQASNLCLLGEAVPKSLNAMRSDIVASVERVAQPGAKKK